MGLLYPYDLYFVEHIYVSNPNDPAESAELFPLPEPGMQSQRPEEATMSGFPSAAWEFSFFLRSREIELTTMEKNGFPFIKGVFLFLFVWTLDQALLFRAWWSTPVNSADFESFHSPASPVFAMFRRHFSIQTLDHCISKLAHMNGWYIPSTYTDLEITWKSSILSFNSQAMARSLPGLFRHVGSGDCIPFFFQKQSQYFYDLLWDVGLPEDMVLITYSTMA